MIDSLRQGAAGPSAVRSATTVRRCFGALLLALPAAGCDLPLAAGGHPDQEWLLGRRGTLAQVEETFLTSIDGDEVLDVALRSTSGLRVTLRLRVPAGAAAGDARSAVVLLGGRDTGADAVRHLPPGIPQLTASLDYPAALRGRDQLRAGPDSLLAALRDVTPSLMLTADYLDQRPETASGRIALIGASLGGFFAPHAAAADSRFVNVALLYSGAHLHELVEHAAGDRVPAAVAALGGDLAALPLQWLEPARHLGSVSPRPVLLVHGLHDDRIPVSSARALSRAARAPRDVVWLESGHLRPDDTALVRELVDSAFARLPVLRAVP